MAYPLMDCLINGEPIQPSESRAHPALLGYENLTLLQKVSLIENCGYGEYSHLDQVHAHPAFYNPMRHYQQERNLCIAPVRLSLNPLDPMHYGSDPAKSSGPDQTPAPGIRVMRKRATYQYQTLPKEVTAQKTHNGIRTSTVPLRNSTITVQDKKRAQISRQATTSTSLLESQKTFNRSRSDRIHNKETAQGTSSNAHPKKIDIPTQVQKHVVPVAISTPPDVSVPQISNSHSDLILNTITTYSRAAAAQAKDTPEPDRDKAKQAKLPLTPLTAHSLITPAATPSRKRLGSNESAVESPAKRTQQPKRACTKTSRTSNPNYVTKG